MSSVRRVPPPSPPATGDDYGRLGGDSARFGMSAERNSMLADDSEQDDIREVIKEVLYEPRDNPLTQSELHELIVKALGRDVDERDTSKRMTELMKNNMITMQMAPSSVIHVAPTKTLEYEVRDKKIRAMDEAGKDIWSKKLEDKWPEESVGLNATYLVEYEPVGSVFEALLVEIESPDLFFVQLREKTKELDRLMKEIEDFYTTEENLESTRFSFETRERCNIYGLLVAVPYTDVRSGVYHGWHRARVLHFVDMENVEVQYIDYGTRAEMSLEWCRLLRRQFSTERLPAQAMAAKLDGICPYPLTRYSNSATEHLRRWADENARDWRLSGFIAEVISRSTVKLSLKLLDTLDPDRIEGYDVAENLVQWKYASWTPVEPEQEEPNDESTTREDGGQSSDDASTICGSAVSLSTDVANKVTQWLTFVDPDVEPETEKEERL